MSHLPTEVWQVLGSYTHGGIPIDSYRMQQSRWAKVELVPGTRARVVVPLCWEVIMDYPLMEENSASLASTLALAISAFSYLGSITSIQIAVSRGTSRTRFNKARCAFSRLNKIWKSKQYSLRTKMCIYNYSNVSFVLLCGPECWKIVKRDRNKVRVFHKSLLEKICNIFWATKIFNNELYQKTGSTYIDLEIKKHWLRRLGHVLKRKPKVALSWTSAG